MDASQPCSPHIKKVLKSYQTAAMTSLSGPNGYMASWGCSSSNTKMGSEGADCGSSSDSVCSSKKSKCEPVDGDPLLAPPPFPIQQMPILVAADQSRSERSETVLEGESISCFVVGGEKRLCLPQILNTVLRDFSLQQINCVCDELQIFCSRCNPEQLEVLKVTGILPFSAPSCGLITKTDAERLCSALQLCAPPPMLDEYPPPPPDGDNDADKRKRPPLRFNIYHECFGKCKGIYTPDLYTGPYARCIECTECRGWFSPQKFVCHAHKALENRTCHWGFDSANWKAYILLAKDQVGVENTVLQKHLDEMKSRHLECPKTKRKQDEDEKEVVMIKKPKYEESSPYFPYMYDSMLPMWYPSAGVANSWPRASAFRPWSPVVGKDGKLASFPHPFPPESVPAQQPLPSYLSHGPPVLLNPERVVPVSETERFERHYQPNVALAPPSAQIQALQKAAQSVPAHSRPKMVYNNSSSNNSHVTPCSTQRTAGSSATPSATATGQGNAAPPAPVNTAQPRKDQRYPSEIELSTDTDETFSDSTFEAGSPACDLSPRAEDKETAAAQPLLEDREDEPYLDLGKPLTQLRIVLKKDGLTDDIQEKILQEASLMWKTFERHLAAASQWKTEFQQELRRVRQSKRERLREASEAKRELRKEVERLCGERDAWHREASELRRQVDRLKAAGEGCRTMPKSGEQRPIAWDLDRVKVEKGCHVAGTADRACQVSLPGENELLRSKIDAMGEELQHLQVEIAQLRRRSQSGGKPLTNGTVPVGLSQMTATSSNCAVAKSGD